ncbi:MAG: hypothetical protein AB7P32_17105 [Nitrospirales bacterium]
MICYQQKSCIVFRYFSLYVEDAGCRPGSRVIAWRVPNGAIFVMEGKGPKTIDAPLGLIGLIGRQVGGDGLTRGARTSPSRTRASDHWAERQASIRGKGKSMK